jgi:hypothetical protein
MEEVRSNGGRKFPVKVGRGTFNKWDGLVRYFQDLWKEE